MKRAERSLCRQCLDSLIDLSVRTQHISDDLAPVVTDMQGYMVVVSIALDTALQALTKAAYQLEKAMER